MISLIHSILVMLALTVVPFLIGLYCGKLYASLKNER
ncbi:hypothetical protein UFOVP66_28 [uncultured Caudovirales phage]|uniref:Uncharacterized protein n=1 Tax=uncultured Caudovirales phage TaxID=2100421 RepID=A0A6J5KQS6_9CAUD|nr:hypothetical protein UFOVP66_28 [uncultured Caudovirales phage]